MDDDSAQVEVEEGEQLKDSEEKASSVEKSHPESPDSPPDDKIADDDAANDLKLEESVQFDSIPSSAGERTSHSSEVIQCIKNIRAYRDELDKNLSTTENLKCLWAVKQFRIAFYKDWESSANRLFRKTILMRWRAEELKRRKS